MDSANLIEDLITLHDAAVDRLRADIATFVRTGAPPPIERRQDGSYCYPELQVHFSGK
ncbi:MAG: nucleosidase, partial [Pseudomonadota bacterium]